MNRFALVALAGALSLTACDSADPVETVDLEARTAADVPADLVVSRSPTTGQVLPGTYSLYDLDTNRLVLSSEESDPAVRQRDSVSTAWDVGFNGTTIIVNGGTSGPGEGSAQIVEQTFASVTEAPATGYVVDGQNTACPASPFGGPGRPLAICTGSDNGWYNYDGAQNLISPLAGRTIVLTTGDGDYAKLRVLSYYRGNPAAPAPTSDEDRYYTFEYLVQPDGSRDFRTTTASDTDG